MRGFKVRVRGRDRREGHKVIFRREMKQFIGQKSAFLGGSSLFYLLSARSVLSQSVISGCPVRVRLALLYLQSFKKNGETDSWATKQSAGVAESLVSQRREGDTEDLKISFAAFDINFFLWIKGR